MPRVLEQAQFVPEDVVCNFGSYRDAVIWCWLNRRNHSCNERQDQAIFAREFGLHAPHVSRFVNPVSNAPMDLRPDLIPAFEGYTGWRGVSQYLLSISRLTSMEQVIAMRSAA